MKMKQKIIYYFNKKEIKYGLIFASFFIFFFFRSFYLKMKRKKYENVSKSKFQENIKYMQDDLTLVTAYYKIKSKHTYSEYLKRLNSFMQLNHSIVFFTSKSLVNILKEMRPKHLLNKTVFIETEIEDFYSYKNFGKEFNKTFYKDRERRYHTVPLYIVWAEKCTFLKKAILSNYFNSKCFYWVDAGYFMTCYPISKYINWPSTKKCCEEPRVLISSLRIVNDSERNKLLNFDFKAHKRLQRRNTVGAGVFGGHPNNVLKFIDYYYDTIRLFISHNIFIGKEQNLFAFVTLSHPEIIKLVPSKGFHFFVKYLS